MEFVKERIQAIAASSHFILPEPLESLVCRVNDAKPGITHYYRFLYLLAKEYRPRLCVELGTGPGIGSACLADGNPKGKVVTVDVAWYALEEAYRENIHYLCQDTFEDLSPFLPGPIDILFMDSAHNGFRERHEFAFHEYRVRPGGVILVDDINLNDEMRSFWEKHSPAGYEKFELPVHGAAGFGVLIKKGQELGKGE